MNKRDGVALSTIGTIDGVPLSSIGTIDGATVAAGGVSYTARWTQGQTPDSTHSGATRNYLAAEFKPNVDIADVSRIDVILIKVGSPTGTLRVRVYNDASSAPTTALGDWSATVDASTVGTTEGNISFFISGDQPDLLASTGNYFAVVDMTSVTRDASNYIGVRYTAPTGTDDQDYSTDLTTWATQDGSSISAIIIYN